MASRASEADSAWEFTHNNNPHIQIDSFFAEFHTLYTCGQLPIVLYSCS